MLEDLSELKLTRLSCRSASVRSVLTIVAHGSCPANAPKGDSIDTRPPESTTPKTPQMFGVSTSRRNPVFWAQEYGAQHRAIFVPDMARSPAGIAKSVIIPALAAQKST